ncbi:NAD(P)/FAD-dependent oxidoreductase [Maritalea mediterranea]|uniref:FAD-binding oxidoreductase n=1 Tax=Maritalea mediterranea TaxID=2909667 RepID=A0ABS9EBM2_9HYPH|nr:FAD-binding oxidoreductase [Maritalea mediterranea]MCF4099150.1 FAD-binding oxidoreductase [Maritalea mediterranea]
MTATPQTNLWQATANAPTFDRTHDQQSVDLAIIGGGFSGCSAALEAAKAGMKVILLEAETIGYGGSGRNVGLVNAGLWTPPQEVEDTLGKPAGEKLNKALAAAPDLVFDLIDQHQIECDAVRNGTLHCAQSHYHKKDLDKRIAQLTARGAPVTMLDEAESQRRLGSRHFVASLFDPRAGTIHPLKYAQGLAEAAQDAGAKIVEHCPATAVQKDEAWRVATRQGEFTAKYVIIATNAYDTKRVRYPKNQFSTVHFFQSATEPLSQDLAAKILPNREGTWDCATVMTSLRMDAENRLILGAIGSLNHATAPFHKMWGRQKLRDLYPELGDVPFTHQWCGKIAMTADHLPKILDLSGRGYAPFGYSGRGIGPGTLFGTQMVKALINQDESLLPLAPITQYEEQLTAAKSTYYECGAAAMHAGYPVLKYGKIG